MKQLSMEELNKIMEAVIGAAIEVHKTLDPVYWSLLTANV